MYDESHAAGAGTLVGPCWLYRDAAASTHGVCDVVFGLGVFRNGQEKTIALNLGTLPEKSEAKSDQQQAPSESSSLGLTLAPASKVPGTGDRGVVIPAWTLSRAPKRPSDR